MNVDLTVSRHGETRKKCLYSRIRLLRESSDVGQRYRRNECTRVECVRVMPGADQMRRVDGYDEVCGPLNHRGKARRFAEVAHLHRTKAIMS